MKLLKVKYVTNVKGPPIYLLPISSNYKLRFTSVYFYVTLCIENRLPGFVKWTTVYWVDVDGTNIEFS